MSPAEELNKIHLDWANGRITLSKALELAYGLGQYDLMKETEQAMKDG